MASPEEWDESRRPREEREALLEAVTDLIASVLERANQRLKKIVADYALDIDMLAGACSGKSLTPELRRRAVGHLQCRFGVSQGSACAVCGQNRTAHRRIPQPPKALAGLGRRQRSWLWAFDQAPTLGLAPGHDLCPRGRPRCHLAGRQGLALFRGVRKRPGKLSCEMSYRLSR